MTAKGISFQESLFFLYFAIQSKNRMPTKTRNKVLITKAELELLYRSNCNLTGKIDPILFPLRYSAHSDKEIAAFIAASLAMAPLNKLMDRLKSFLQTCCRHHPYFSVS
jgi:hypothetical protein